MSIINRIGGTSGGTRRNICRRIRTMQGHKSTHREGRLPWLARCRPSCVGREFPIYRVDLCGNWMDRRGTQNALRDPPSPPAIYLTRGSFSFVLYMIFFSTVCYYEISKRRGVGKIG